MLPSCFVLQPAVSLYFCRVLKLIQAFSMSQLQQQVRKACAEAASEGIKLDAHRLAEKMELPGYSFRVRTALGGGWGGDCLRQLRHFFLTCVVSGEALNDAATALLAARH